MKLKRRTASIALVTAGIVMVGVGGATLAVSRQAMTTGSAIAETSARHREPPSAARVVGADDRAISFMAGRPGQVISQGLQVWATAVPPGRYNITFKAAIAATTAGQDTEFVCGAVDRRTLGRTGTPWIYVAQSGSVSSTSQLGSVFLSGAATVPVRSTARPGLVCFSPQGSFRLVTQVVATYTRIKSRTVTTAPAVPLGKAVLDHVSKAIQHG
jgi:hypothetical protein